MAALWRKLWDTVSTLAGAVKSAGNPSSELVVSSLPGLSSDGFFDKLPADVFMQILMLVEPKEVVRAGLVCKAWKAIVEDDRLWIHFLQTENIESWDSLLFAEMNLRSGHPLVSYPSQPHLSFMHMYSEKAQQSGCVIIDGGSGYCKYGWSKFSSPSGHCSTFMEFGNIQSPIYMRLRHFFVTIFSRMQVKPSTQPVILSIPICHSDDTESAKASRRQLKDAMYSVLFDMNVPSVCAIDQATLALFAARRTSGIVVNIGFNVTSVVPIFKGRIMRQIGVETVGQGGLKLTSFLRQQMQDRGINFESLYTVRTLKENLCYVASDYEAELSKNTRSSFEIPGQGCFTLSQERFRTAEILFQPQIGGVRAMGLHQAVALCMDHCASAELIEFVADDSWFKTIILAGGTSCLPGLPERLEKELCTYLPSSLADGVKVIPPLHGPHSAWFGAKITANVSTFNNTWCVTKKQFRQSARRNSFFMGSW